MAEKVLKQFLDENGLKTVFKLICENHYSTEEVDELLALLKDELEGKIDGIDVTEQLSDYLKSSDAEDTYLKQTDAESTYVKQEDLDLSAYPDSAEYVSASKQIQFKHNGVVLSGMTVDATEFVKDGMVKSVELVDTTGTTDDTQKAIKITFNVDASSGTTEDVVVIPIGDLFDIDLYYTKTVTDSTFLKQSAAISDDDIEAIYDEVLGKSE